MKSIVYLLYLINLVFCVPDQKLRESEDGSKFYIETDMKYTWFEAWSNCASKNMSLIAIDSYAKHQQIDNLLRRLYTAGQPAWTAGHDNAVQLRYEWASTGLPFSFTNWATGQPADPTKDHCILLWKDFQWHDYPCTNKLGYICEEHPFAKRQCDKPSPLSKTNEINELRNLLFYFQNGK